MTTTEDLSVLDQPLETRGEDVDDVLATGGRRRWARSTVALAAAALVATGVLGGVLIRGVVDTSDGGTGGTTAASGGMPSGDQAGGFPGGDTGTGGTTGDSTTGTVTAVGTADLIIELADGSTVTVLIGDATTVTVSGTGTATPALEVGDTVTVVGTDSDGSIAATSVSEGSGTVFGPGGGMQQGPTDTEG